MFRKPALLSILSVAGLILSPDFPPALGADKECAVVSSLETDQDVCFQGQCPRKGNCDCPDTRDLWLPDQSTGTTTIRVKLNVFHPRLVDPEDVAIILDQINKINTDFGPYNIQFQVDYDQFPGSPYARIETQAEVFPMKNDYADNPAYQLNVYVVDVLIDEDGNGQVDYLGSGVYPWTEGATGPQGGVLVDGDHFGGGFTLLTHEIGHCLGLWHTFHGSGGELADHGGCCPANPPQCAVPCEYCCYESAECTGDCSDPACDLRGDFCCDTPGTIIHTECGQVQGTDECPDPDRGWEPSGFHNFMGYTPQTCRTEFTLRQAGRMHCWTCDTVAGWVVGNDITGACCLNDGDCRVMGQSCCGSARWSVSRLGDTVSRGYAARMLSPRRRMH